MTYDGASWVTIGNAGFSADSIEDVSLALDGNGTPYVAYVDDGQCPDGQVKRLIGGDAKKSIPRHVECVARPQ